MNAERIAPSATVGARVMAAIILVAGIALATSGTIVWFLGQQTLHTDIDEHLQRSRERFEVLATEGVDPATGTSFTDASQVVYTYIQRSVVRPGESELGFVGQDLRWYPSAAVTLHPEQDADLVARLSALAAEPDATTTTITTSKGTYRVMVVPLRDGSTQASLAHVVDLEAAEADLRRTMVIYAAAATATVALVAALAWFVVERLLAPIGELRRTTEAIGEKDLTSRVPVRGRDDLSSLARAINRMLDRVQRSVEAERSLLDDVGHELRTPITIIRGHLELLDPQDTQDVDQTRTLVIDELDRMGMMVNDLLELAKITDSEGIRPQPTAIGELTVQVFNKAQALGERDWQLEEAVEAVCHADPVRLTQAWLQLAANAVKYSDPGSRIALGSRLEGALVHLWVADEGIGIAAQDLELVRRRFGRSAAAEQKASGTGLGLSIVENIIGAHEGELDISSQPGIGSVFTLKLPYVHDGTATRPPRA